LVLRLLEHLLGEINPGEAAVDRVKGKIQPRADPDLENVISRLDIEQTDRGFTTRMEDPVEDEVIRGGRTACRPA